MKHCLMFIALFFYASLVFAKIKVAVIDTGVDPNHNELREFLWKNPGESGLDAQGNNKANNGIDDDKNGLVDDLYGFNFSDNNSDISDTHGHGTHISGLIAKDNKPKDLALVTLKYYNPHASGEENLKSLIKSFKYALSVGVDIINMSGGGNSYSQLEWEVLREAQRKGIIICAASGNKGVSLSTEAFYPASYPLENIISVASTNESGQLLESSNFGAGVDFAAPGYKQVSSLPANQRGPMTGTSQATANLCGAIAGLLAKTKDRSLEKVRTHLIATGIMTQSLNKKTKFGVRVHRRRALYMRPMNLNAIGQTDPVLKSPRAPAGAGSF